MTISTITTTPPATPPTLARNINAQKHIYKGPRQQKFYKSGQRYHKSNTYLLHVRAHENMLNRLGVKHPTRIRQSRRLMVHIEEKILVQLIEEEESKHRKAIDDR